MGKMEHFWSQTFIGGVAAFASLFVLGRLGEAVTASFADDAPLWVAQSLNLTACFALFIGGSVAGRLSPGRGRTFLLTGVAIWTVLGLVVLHFAMGGMEVFGSASMFGEILEPDLEAGYLTMAWSNFGGILLSLGSCVLGTWLGGRVREVTQERVGTHRARRVPQLFWRINHVARNHS